MYIANSRVASRLKSNSLLGQTLQAEEAFSSSYASNIAQPLAIEHQFFFLY